MTQNSKISLALVLMFVLTGIVVLTAADSGTESQTSTVPEAVQSGDAEVLRDNTHILDEAEDGKVTLVEFLDFECEACLALYPVIEQLREEYRGEVTFAIRYFPIESHFNAKLAAQTVEAASKQGELEAMYQKMYETQTEWGEQQSSARDVFFGFAEELGLDMEQFETDVDSDETAERVEYDRKEGLALGVQGTPTLFLNGEQIQPAPFEEMKAQIDAALEE